MKRCINLQKASCREVVGVDVGRVRHRTDRTQKYVVCLCTFNSYVINKFLSFTVTVNVNTIHNPVAITFPTKIYL